MTTEEYAWTDPTLSLPERQRLWRLTWARLLAPDEGSGEPSEQQDTNDEPSS